MPVKNGVLFFRAAFLIPVVLLGGCRQELRHVGDVDDIRKFGVLRVVVRPGFFTSSQLSDGNTQEAYLLRQMAGRLGVNIHWIEAVRHDQILMMLRDGRADIAVSRFSPASLLGDEFRATTAIDWVEDLLIVGQNSEIDSLDSLRRGIVYVHGSELTGTMRSLLEKEKLIAETVPEEVSLEEIVRRVQLGRYPLTVIDSGVVNNVRATKKIVVLGPLAERRALVWAVRSTSPRLRLAIDDFLFAERVLARDTRTHTCRDLKRIRQAGVLRLITRNSPTTCTVERGGLAGFEYDLVSSFARSLGLRIELSIPPPGIDPLDWLERGYGDLTALHEPVSPLDSGRFLVSFPYRKVDLVSVVSAKAIVADRVLDLAGVRVAASRPVAELGRLLPLPAPMLTAVPQVGADAFNAMIEVARGKVPVAVVNRDAAKLELANRPDLRLGGVVLPEVELVWVCNTTSPGLLDEADGWLRQATKSGLVRQLVLNEFGTWRSHVPLRLPPVPQGALTPYDELLKWVGRENEIDWRLLASLMYEESRFDPDAVGPGGSAGLFQFMPFTWRELGVEDPHHPAEAAEAGGRYLRELMDKFNGLPLPDRVAMAIASYNVGPRHVFDARKLAREMGFDPDTWAGSVETAMLILDDQDVARRFPAGVCRCRRAVGYTRRILRRYVAYTEQFPPA